MMSSGSRTSRSNLLMNEMMGVLRWRQTSIRRRVCDPHRWPSQSPSAPSPRPSARGRCLPRSPCDRGVGRLITWSRELICITDEATEMTALLFDLHPVRGLALRAGLAALDGTGNLDRTREQQQLFGQRGLTRVRVEMMARCGDAGFLERKSLDGRRFGRSRGHALQTKGRKRIRTAGRKS